MSDAEEWTPSTEERTMRSRGPKRRRISFGQIGKGQGKRKADFVVDDDVDVVKWSSSESEGKDTEDEESSSSESGSRSRNYKSGKSGSRKRRKTGRCTAKKRRRESLSARKKKKKKRKGKKTESKKKKKSTSSQKRSKRQRKRRGSDDSDDSARELRPDHLPKKANLSAERSAPKAVQLLPFWLVFDKAQLLDPRWKAASVLAKSLDGMSAYERRAKGFRKRGKAGVNDGDAQKKEYVERMVGKEESATSSESGIQETAEDVKVRVKGIKTGLQVLDMLAKRFKGYDYSKHSVRFLIEEERIDTDRRFVVYLEDQIREWLQGRVKVRELSAALFNEAIGGATA